MLTVRSLLQNVLLEAGLALGEIPEDIEMQYALSKYNQMIDSWVADGLLSGTDTKTYVLNNEDTIPLYDPSDTDPNRPYPGDVTSVAYVNNTNVDSNAPYYIRMQKVSKEDMLERYLGNNFGGSDNGIYSWMFFNYNVEDGIIQLNIPFTGTVSVVANRIWYASTYDTVLALPPGAYNALLYGIAAEVAIFYTKSEKIPLLLDRSAKYLNILKKSRIQTNPRLSLQGPGLDSRPWGQYRYYDIINDVVI